MTRGDDSRPSRRARSANPKTDPYCRDSPTPLYVTPCITSSAYANSHRDRRNVADRFRATCPLKAASTSPNRRTKLPLVFGIQVFKPDCTVATNDSSCRQPAFRGIRMARPSASGAESSPLVVIARVSEPEVQEQRVAHRRNSLHPLRATERCGALLEQVRQAAGFGPKSDVGAPSNRDRVT